MSGSDVNQLIFEVLDKDKDGFLNFGEISERRFRHMGSSYKGLF